MPKFFYVFILMSLLSACGNETQTPINKQKELATFDVDDRALHFAPNRDCQSCHPIIYEEYQSAMHAKSTIFEDSIHAAVWAKHPKNLKMGQYACAKCHTPAADNIDSFLVKGVKAVPDINNPTHQEAISCTYCHRVEGVKEGKKSNTAIVGTKEKHYLGNRKDHIASSYHGIATDNESFASGQMCMSCHSHKANKSGLNVCVTDMNDSVEEQNCISCHMPQVEGAVSALNPTATHAYHGFPGTNNDPDMLAQYIGLALDKKAGSFAVKVNNQSPHALLLHPLRVGQLRVKVWREGKELKEFDPIAIVRLIGDQGKPTPPWKATEVVKNTMIEGGETKSFAYDFALEKGDEVEVVLGYYLVNPKQVDKLGLANYKKATQFVELKQERIKY